MELSGGLATSSIVWTLFFLNSGIFKPILMFGEAFPSQAYRMNETLYLTVALPAPTSAEDPSGGLLWQDLSVVTPDNHYLLHPSSGFVENGAVCGILGPSGAGKTTFLSSIAGRPEASLNLYGNVLHYAVTTGDKSQSITVKCAPTQTDSVAWLRQHDAFFERLTVRETLDLATFLELPHLTLSERDEVAQSCLDSLGLSAVQSRYVGSAKASHVSDGASLSGGELRRLSVAVELVSMPNLLVADEPTSGIDSKMSENVMTAIASLARQRQIPCFCTLHQPRSSIWHMLDSVILMATGGKIIYTGSRKDAILYFSSLGYECPSQTNPAEFLIDLVSVDPENVVQAVKDTERINKLAYEFTQYTRKQTKTSLSSKSNVCSIFNSILPVDSKKIAASRHPFRAIRRFGALFKRSWRQNFRYTFLNVFRLGVSTGTALLLAQIFPSVTKGGAQPKSVADRVALLSFGVINMMMTAVMKTMEVFSKEKPVIQRERHRNLYSCFEYLIGKFFAEIPLDIAFAAFFTTTLKAKTGLSISWQDITAIFSLMTVAGASLGFLIGSMTPSSEAAVSTGIPILIIMMIVGVINPSGVDPTVKTPPLIKLIKSISPIASAIEALSVAEFTGMQFETRKSFLGWRRWRDATRMGGVALVKNGDEVLDALGLNNMKYLDIMRHMVKLSAINFGLCWLFLHVSSTSGIWRRKVKTKKQEGVDGIQVELEQWAAGGRKIGRGSAPERQKSVSVAFKPRI